MNGVYNPFMLKFAADNRWSICCIIALEIEGNCITYHLKRLKQIMIIVAKSIRKIYEKYNSKELGYS